MKLKLFALCVVTLTACGKEEAQPQNLREFATGNSLAAAIDADGSATKKVGKDEGKVIGKDMDSGKLDPNSGNNPGGTDPTGKDPGQNGKDPGQNGKTPPVDKKNDLPPEIKAKLTACYPQWEKLPWPKDTLIDIRQFNLDTASIKASRIEFVGTRPEVLFIDINSDRSIKYLSVKMLNKMALYCVDIKAKQSIGRLELTNICGAKVGVIDLGSKSKTKQIVNSEICDTKPSPQPTPMPAKTP